ncbi:hypothetical protein CLU79DRAFT_722846 [Phycomyces nitens]|nr:hypothetical protein CLU79DRAFT_722846 [Phycomyces nitens]
MNSCYSDGVMTHHYLSTAVWRTSINYRTSILFHFQNLVEQDYLELLHKQFGSNIIAAKTLDSSLVEVVFGSLEHETEALLKGLLVYNSGKRYRLTATRTLDPFYDYTIVCVWDLPLETIKDAERKVRTSIVPLLGKVVGLVCSVDPFYGFYDGRMEIVLRDRGFVMDTIYLESYKARFPCSMKPI